LSYRQISSGAALNAAREEDSIRVAKRADKVDAVTSSNRNAKPAVELIEKVESVGCGGML